MIKQSQYNHNTKIKSHKKERNRYTSHPLHLAPDSRLVYGIFIKFFWKERIFSAFRVALAAAGLESGARGFKHNV